MPEDKLVELLAGVVGAFVGTAGDAPQIRAALRDLVEDDFYWEAATQADALSRAAVKDQLDG